MRTLGFPILVLLVGACGNNSGLAPTTASSGAASGTTGTASGSTSGASGATSGSGGTSATASTSGATGTSGHTATSASGSSASTTSGSSTTASSTSSGASTTSGVNLTTIPDPDPSVLPVVSNPSNNPVLNPINVITVTFSGYPYTAQAQAVGDWLASSNYIQNAIGEYGVGQVINTNVDTGQAAPATINDFGIQSWITSNTAPTGMLPAPATGYTPVYVLYYPAATTVTNGVGGVSCQAFSGYHEENAGQLFTSVGAYYYAVINDCGTGVEDVEAIGVHEIAEAATDPQDIDFSHDAWVDRDTSSPYVQSNLITEIADLCEGQYIFYDAGAYVLRPQQLWSENAALDGGAPCVPVDPNRPYYTVLPDSLSKTAAAGSNAVFNLTGWSSAPLMAWGLSTYGWSPALNAFTPGTIQLGAATISNGQVVTLTVPVPAGTASGAGAGVFVYCELGDGTYNTVPVLVTAM